YVPGPKEPEQAPLSSDYVPGSEEPEQVPPSPVYLPYVPKLVYPEYMPPEDDVFSAKEQSLPAAATPTADSPGYILEFDPKGDPKEDDEEDPEEDHADYPADSTVVALPAIDHVPFEEVTEPLPQIPSPPLPIPSPPPPNSPTHIEIIESCLPLQKRLRFASPTPSQEVGKSSAASAARQDEPAVARDDPYSLGVNQRVTDLFTVVKQETTIMYGIMEDAQDDRSQLRGRVNLLYRDRPVHRRLAVMIEREARMTRDAWDYPWMLATMHVQMLCHYILPDHKRHIQLTKALRLLKGLQTQMIEFQRHHGPAKKMETKQTKRSTPVITTPAPETTTTTSVTNAQLQAMIDQGVTAALAGTEGVVGLSQWFEKTESVYSISNCTVACQVKFSTYTLQGNALTWWNSHVKTTTPEAANAMPWRTLKKMMTDKYCPRGEIKKLEFECNISHFLVIPDVVKFSIYF
nr:putative reverse transcriptase domain-containing protein [Tanacetum cinerariifolium]GEZ74190.1 putative reverse transcriptase domain-containing protein [Tanacetum cinerariifolium]